MSETVRTLAYAVWELLHALSVLLLLLAPVLVPAVAVALFVKSRRDGS